MGVALPEILALAAFACMAFLVCLYYAYGYSLGAFLDWIVAEIKKLPSIGIPHTGFHISFDFLAVPFESANNAIRYALAKGIEATSATGLYFWHWSAYVFDKIGEVIHDLAHATEAALAHALHIHVPRFVTDRIRFLTAQVHALTKAIEGLPHRAEVIIQKPVQVIRTEITKVEHAAVAIPGIAIQDLEDAASWTRHSLKRLAKILTPAGIIGLVGATFFQHYGLGWLRCRGVGRVGRALCGASGLIETFAAGAITAFAVSDLCRFAYGIEKVAEDIRPAMLAWVDVENALFRCSSADFPPPLRVASLSPTPVFDAVAL